MQRLLVVAALMALGATVACVDRSSPDASAPPVAGGVVDSALPIDTLLHRFRATLADTPSVLTGGAASPEAAARALLRALQTHDTATLRSLVLSRAEFAWLYYPHTKFTKPPYELGPDLVWLQMGAGSEKGASRLLERYGGSRLRFEAVGCPDSITMEGPNRIISGCRVRFAAADSAIRELRLFGSLLNRDGRYKFVSYSNDL